MPSPPDDESRDAQVEDPVPPDRQPVASNEPVFGQTLIYLFEFDTEDPVERVIQLWHMNDGWIPGADWKRLADALMVPHERLEIKRT